MMLDEEHTARLTEAANRLSLYLEFAAESGLDAQVKVFSFESGGPTLRRGVAVNVKRLTPYERREPYDILPFT